MERGALLERLTDIAVTTGFGADSLRELASASGSSARMLMYYFTSREELLAEIARNLLSRFRGMLAEETLEPGPAEIPTSIARLWYSLSARRNEGLLRSLLQLSASALAGKDGLDQFRGSAIDELKRAVSSLVPAGPSARPQISALTVTLWGGASALVMTGDRALANEAVLAVLETLKRE